MNRVLTPFEKSIQSMPLKKCVSCKTEFSRRNAAHKICDACKLPRKCACSPDCLSLVKGFGRTYHPGHCDHSGHKQSDYQKEQARKAQLGRPKSEEQKKKQSLLMRGRYTGVNNPFFGKKHPPSLLRKIGKKLKGRVSTFKGHHHTPENKLLLGRLMSERLIAGFVPWSRRRAVYTRRGKKITMRSTWEVKYAKWLDSQKISWQYEPHSFKTSLGYYLPDFYVPVWCSYVEIKGYDPPGSKAGAFAKEYPTEKLVLLRQKDLERLGVL